MGVFLVFKGFSLMLQMYALTTLKKKKKKNP